MTAEKCQLSTGDDHKNDAYGWKYEMDGVLNSASLCYRDVGNTEAT